VKGEIEPISIIEMYDRRANFGVEERTAADWECEWGGRLKR
jgi:hypothetical protein